MNKRLMKKKLKILFVVFVIVCIYLFYSDIVYRQSGENRTKVQETTTSSLQPLSLEVFRLSKYKIMKKAFQAHRKEEEYGTYVIPGLKATKTLKDNEVDTCTSMTPQSICIVNNYILIGAYCHAKEHNSVVYVIDKNKHSLVKTLVLNSKSHVGGLAYDPVNDIIWISGHEKYAQANAFSYGALKSYSFDKTKKPVDYLHSYNILTIPRDSFMTYYKGYLYIGYFQMNNNSVVQQFKVTGTGALKERSSAEYQQYYSEPLPEKIIVPMNITIIANKVQGMAFFNNNLLISQSYGILPSKILVYDVDSTFSSNQNYTKETAKHSISLPQKLEQIYVDGREVYTLFESGSYAYRTYSFPSVDRIVKLNIYDVLKGD